MELLVRDMKRLRERFDELSNTMDAALKAWASTGEVRKFLEAFTLLGSIRFLVEMVEGGILFLQEDRRQQDWREREEVPAVGELTGRRES